MQTIQEIYNGDLDKSIREFLNQVTYPETPVRPRKPSGETSVDYANYAKELEVYEKQKLQFLSEKGRYLAVREGLEDELRLFLIELSG